MKRKQVFALGGTFLLFIALLLYICTFVQPKITFIAQVENISTADYKRILNNKHLVPADSNIDKFKNVILYIKVTSPLGIINHINIGNISLHPYLLKQYLENYDKVQVLSGGYFAQGDYTEFRENEEVYLKNESEDDLRNMLGNFRLKFHGTIS